ncbi:MAG: EamA family transporter, partial [Candidatus Acetothermia bacterium]
FLALSAMQLAQLGYVASFRNVSVVFATLLGVVKLKEEFTFYRLIGSLVIFLGAVLLSVG